MFYKPLNEVNLNDLQLLVANKVKEGSQLDYKLKLPESNDKGKVELLKDISAFANTSGGYLIYGIEEKDAVADKIIGIEDFNFDDQKLYIENLVRTNIEPRLVGLEFQEIDLDSLHTVLIIRIPRSWNSPHVVSFAKHWRFYARNSAGNYQMDVTQLRDSFILGSSINEKLEEKRKERLKIIERNYITGKSPSLPVLVTHIQPFDSIRPDILFDLSLAEKATKRLTFGFDDEINRPQYNFDGFILRKNRNYVQIYRSGMIELLNTDVFNPENDVNILHATYLEWGLNKGVGECLEVLKSLRVDNPLFLQVSLLGIYKYKLKVKKIGFGNPHHEVHDVAADRRDLITNSVFIDSLSNFELEGDFNDEIRNCWKTAESILLSVYDSIWNAFGFPRCLYYDENGNRTGSIQNSF